MEKKRRKRKKTNQTQQKTKTDKSVIYYIFVFSASITAIENEKFSLFKVNHTLPLLSSQDDLDKSILLEVSSCHVYRSICVGSIFFCSVSVFCHRKNGNVSNFFCTFWCVQRTFPLLVPLQTKESMAQSLKRTILSSFVIPFWM